MTAGRDQEAPADLRVFFYLPLEHSEALADQDQCVTLCQALDAASGSEWIKWAEMHRAIITHFARFPHRNAQCWAGQVRRRRRRFWRTGALRARRA